MSRGLRICAALLLTGTSVSAAAGVKDGVDAWSRGDFTKAVAEWQGPAAAGDADAQFNLAQAYKLGKGVEADLGKAEKLYLKAAQQGHLQAADMFGLVLFQTGRRDAAMGWLARSAERGEPRAQYVLGVAHFNGDRVRKDPVRAYALMTRAAAAGLETAKDTLATMDSALPLEQRQAGVALAAELEAKANTARAAQLAALGLGTKPTRQTAAAVAAPKPPTILKPVTVTAGADLAKPVALGASPVKAAAAPPAPLVTTAGNWRVQLGAFGVAGNAQALWTKLRAGAVLGGRRAFFVPAGKLTKLQAGPFATRADAQAACVTLSGQACLPVEG